MSWLQTSREAKAEDFLLVVYIGLLTVTRFLQSHIKWYRVTFKGKVLLSQSKNSDGKKLL